MPPWIIEFALPVVAGSLVTAYLWLWRRPHLEAQRGVLALANLRWREFSHLVRQAMRQQRGLEEVQIAQEKRTAPGSDFLMHKDGQRILLSCKHGRAYRIGAVAVDELAANARLSGAKSSLLLTVGRVEHDGLAAAAQQGVEVIDERKVWPFLRPVVPDEVWADVVDATRRQAVRHTFITALAAIALGAIISVGLGALRPASETTAEVSPPAVVAPPSAALNTADGATAPPGLALVPAVEDLDPDQLLRLQADLSRALKATKGLNSGVWLTRSTVAVDRSVDDEAAWQLICANLERFPPLHNIRIQLNPRPGTKEPVRWRQCSFP